MLEAIKTRRFFHLGLILFNGMFFGSYLVSTFKPVALNAGVIKDDEITIIGSLSMISNGAARLVWSSMQDKFGFKKVYFVLLIIQFVISLSIYSFRQDLYSYLILVCVAMACEGGHFTMFPTVCVEIFGI